MQYRKFRHRKVVRNMHKKARRIGFIKVFGKYPSARSETTDFKLERPSQRLGYQFFIQSDEIPF